MLHQIIDRVRLKSIERLIEVQASPNYSEATLVNELSHSNDSEPWDELKKAIDDLTQKLDIPRPGDHLSVRFFGRQLTYEVPQAKDLLLSSLLKDGLEILPKLSPNDYMFIFASLFMEKTIIFVSEDRHLLGLTVQYFSTLIRPLDWPFPVIYSLPENCLQILGSPLPVIAGLLQPGERVMNDILPEYSSMTKDTIFMFLDHSHILASKETVSQIRVPRLNKSIKLLHESIKSLFSANGSTSISYNSNSRDFTRKGSASKLPKVIVNIKENSPRKLDRPPEVLLHSYLSGLHKALVDNLTPHKPDDRNECELEIRQRLGPKDSKFLDKFFATQTFSFFLQNLQQT